MRYAMKATLIATLILSAALAAQAGHLTAPAGYMSTDTALSMPAYAWFGGFDILPNGNFAIIDGYDVREISPTGQNVGTIYHFSSFVYGSFVKYNPASGKLYFGESSTGAIRSISLAGGTATTVATVANNFDIDFSNGTPYVAAGLKVFRLDETAGIAEAIADVTNADPNLAKASGPLAFDSAGNLVYGTGDRDWGTPRDQRIIRWSAAEIVGAGGENVLGLSDSDLLADGVSPYGFAWSVSGELLFSETLYPSAIQGLSGGSVSPFAGANGYDGITYVRVNPADGSVSAAVSWFDANWNQFTVISTLRPVPEPSSLLALGTMIVLAAGAKPLRARRKS